MTPLERRWVRDLLGAFAPERTDPLDPSGAAAAGTRGLAPLPGEVDYLGVFERMRARATRLAGLGLRAALWLVALAPVWRRGRLHTLSALPVHARAAELAALLVHRSFVVRELTLLLKLCAAMALLAAPGVRARSAYDDIHGAPANESGVRKKHGALVVLHDDAPHDGTARAGAEAPIAPEPRRSRA